MVIEEQLAGTRMVRRSSRGWGPPCAAPLVATDSAMTEDLLPAVMEFAERASPPLAVTGSSNSSSMTYAVVEVRDGHVVWRFASDRSSDSKRALCGSLQPPLMSTSSSGFSVTRWNRGDRVQILWKRPAN